MKTADIIEVEETSTPPFFAKIPIAIERGQGVRVWDTDGNRYLDLTAGWGVTSLGHAHPVITRALEAQSRKIIQNPNSGLTYAPERARLLTIMKTILPGSLTRVFFSNSGAEANDAAIKLARKVTRRREVIATYQGFHGRTISTASATGQESHRRRYNPLMPNYRFVPFDDIPALRAALDTEVAAVILEPIQGEGGVQIPSAGYLEAVSQLCHQQGSLLIVDEIQTGFFRTGPVFAISEGKIAADFMTMAKGIAGGFPLGALAMTESVAAKLEIGDHGGTYCGNPLGCAVAHAVITCMLEQNIETHVTRQGAVALTRLQELQTRFPDLICTVRGRGLLLAIEFHDQALATSVTAACLARQLLVQQTQGRMIRIFPALNISADEIAEGLTLLEAALNSVSADPSSGL